MLSLMKKLMKILIYLSVFLNFKIHASTLFIGNGGDLIKIDNQFYLRDLVENNTFHTPFYYFNNNSIEVTHNINSDFLSELNISSNLLENKLLDVGILIPGLDGILAELINKHSWQLVEQNLGLLPDDGSTLDLSIFERHQLANRSLNRIQINKWLWFKLDEKQKVAVIFHELLYSLLKPVCSDPECKYMIQPSRLARHITGKLHEEDTFLKPEKTLAFRKMAYSILNLEDLSSVKAFKVILSASLPNTTNLFYNEYPSTNAILTTLDDICQSLITEPTPKDVSVTLSAHTQGFPIITPVQYNSIYGLETGYKVQIEQNLNVKTFLIRNHKDCKKNLSEKIRQL